MIDDRPRDVKVMASFVDWSEGRGSQQNAMVTEYWDGERNMIVNSGGDESEPYIYLDDDSDDGYSCCSISEINAATLWFMRKGPRPENVEPVDKTVEAQKGAAQ